MNATVELGDVLRATQAQRNALADDNAMMNARIVALERQVKKLLEEIALGAIPSSVAITGSAVCGVAICGRTVTA